MPCPASRPARHGLLSAALALVLGCAPGPPLAPAAAGAGARAEGASPHQGEGELRGPPWVGRAWSPAAGRLQPETSLLREMEVHRFVLLGERHDNPDHHRRQARAIRHLAASGRRPAVVFEMLAADVSRAIAEVQARPRPRAEELRRAVGWDASGWPAWELYAPVFEAALEAELPVVAGDLGASALAALRREGLEGLEPSVRRALGLDEPVPKAWRQRLKERIRRAHCDLLPEEALPRMVDVQLARDAHLARALAQAAGPGGAVLIAGAGHVRRDGAVPTWLQRRGIPGTVASVALVEVASGGADPRQELLEHLGGWIPYDWAWFTPEHPREDPCERVRRALERRAPSG